MRVLARRLPFLVFAAVLASASAGPVLADAEERKQNPYKGDADAILVGEGLFRYYCAGCHGMEGGGGFRGPDLTRGQLTHVADDHDMLGVGEGRNPGNPDASPDASRQQSVAHDRLCHRSSNQGPTRGIGRGLGIGAGALRRQGVLLRLPHGSGRGRPLRARPDGHRKNSLLESFLEAVREPSAQFKNVLQADGRMAGGYESVRLVTPSGERITGVVRNEDTYTIQVLDQQENYHSYRKSELREITHLDQSLMPVYSESALSDQDLKDLLLFLTRSAAE